MAADAASSGARVILRTAQPSEAIAMVLAGCRI
jgi:hypothetical protein